MIDISIIIVNWNTSDLLQQCLNSIYDGGSHLAFEIIVVDNRSTDNSIAVVKKRFPDVVVIQNHENLGFAKANNQGISKAKGRYHLLLNSDTVILPGALDELVRAGDHHSDVGVLSPKLLNMDNTLQESWASFPTFRSELTGRNFRDRQLVADFPSAYDVDWVSGACMLVRSETVRDVGVLDEDYFMYSEEADWCFRIKKAGWKIWYLSSTAIYHLGGGSAKRTSLTQLILLYRGKLLFFHKHYGVTHALLLRYGLIITNTLGLIRRIILLLGKDRHAVQKRLVVQYKLIRSLLFDCRLVTSL